MENKIRYIKEHLQGISVVGNTWRLVSIVRERLMRRSEIKRRKIEERDARRNAERQIAARMIKII